MLASYWRVMQELRAKRRAEREAEEAQGLDQAALDRMCDTYGHDLDCIHNRKGEPE